MTQKNKTLKGDIKQDKNIFNNFKKSKMTPTKSKKLNFQENDNLIKSNDQENKTSQATQKQNKNIFNNFRDSKVTPQKPKRIFFQKTK